MTGQQLCEAARDGDATNVRTLLSTQGSQTFINYQDALGRTPLFMAASGGHAAVTKQLLAARCKVDLQVELKGCTPIHAAAFHGHAPVTKQLIVARCNVDLQEKLGITAFHFVAAKGHETITKQLLAARCNVDLQANNDATALQIAEGQGHAGIAALQSPTHAGVSCGSM
jgi:ankyrin repeat protein